MLEDINIDEFYQSNNYLQYKASRSYSLSHDLNRKKKHLMIIMIIWRICIIETVQ